MRPRHVIPERPARSVSVDALAAFVPALRAGARSLRREADRAKREFRPTDLDMLVKDARALEALAVHFDARQARR